MSADYTATITVNRTPAEVYDAINDVAGWWGRITGTTTAEGDEFVYVVPGLHYSGFRVTELEPGRRIAWIVTGSYLSFVDDKQEWNGTTVRFDITADRRRHTGHLHPRGAQARGRMLRRVLERVGDLHPRQPGRVPRDGSGAAELLRGRRSTRSCRARDPPPPYRGRWSRSQRQLTNRRSTTWDE